MITRIDPPIPVDTPRGKGMAHFLIDYGVDHHMLWGCFLDDTRECWWLPNPEIRARDNPSMGRPTAPAPVPEEEVAQKSGEVIFCRCIAPIFDVNKMLERPSPAPCRWCSCPVGRCLGIGNQYPDNFAA